MQPEKYLHYFVPSSLFGMDRTKEILFQLECKSRTPEVDGALPSERTADPCAPGTAGAPSLPALFEQNVTTHDVDLMQMDLFAPSLPPLFEKLADLDIAQLTPMQAMQVLDELVRQLRRMR